MVVMFALGLIVRRWLRIASALGAPMVRVVAGTCRLMLDCAILSASTKVRLVMPVRMRASAVQLPTPPIPNIMTFFLSQEVHCFVSDK